MARSAGIDWATEAHEVCVVEDGEVICREEIPHDERGIDGKSDRFDAFVLAELARTGAHRFGALVPDSDLTKALRALTRSREDLVGIRVELANQLRAQLEAFWPGAAQVFGDVDSKIGLAFLRRYPSPADARGLGERRMAAFLTREGYSGGKSAGELIARRAIVLGLVDALVPLLGQIAELGDVRERYPTEASLAADAGQSPVAVESGKRRVAVFRRACDKRLRGAVATLANSTPQWHPWAQDIYRRARERGADHPHAIRILGRAWVRVLWRCWADEVPYDPALHGGLSRLQPSGG